MKQKLREMKGEIDISKKLGNLNNPLSKWIEQLDPLRTRRQH